MKSMLIECDNLSAMKRLLPDLAERIDVMPVDPPYNTAVPYTGYRDSAFAGGWKRFMKKRLNIAFRLLSAHGVMFIHIDEKEFCSLYSLCGRIFGKENLMSLIWKKTNGRFDGNREEKPLESGVRRTHEYVVVCFKDKRNTVLHPVRQPVWNGTYYEEVTKPLETILDDLGTNASAKDELEEIFGERNVFRTPKPVKLIKELIRAGSEKNSIVMDFFAGSGTTGQAVMELNREDGGNRRFLLITNDENDTCEKVALPRLRRAVELCGCEDFSYEKWC